MNTKFITLINCMLVISVLPTLRALAQQPQYVKPEMTAEQMVREKASANYTYHVFEAPNKMFGYDIFRNGRIIFHQAASADQPNNLFVALAKKPQAEKAALLVIERIKKGEPATLTPEEIKKIIAQ